MTPLVGPANEPRALDPGADAEVGGWREPAARNGIAGPKEIPEFHARPAGNSPTRLDLARRSE
jgi:hypothetical protein